MRVVELPAQATRAPARIRPDAAFVAVTKRSRSSSAKRPSWYACAGRGASARR